MNSPYDPDLAYGSPYPESPRSGYQSSIGYGSSGALTPPPPASTSIYIHPVDYESLTPSNRRMMDRLISSLYTLPSPSFHEVLAKVGSLRINFDKTDGHGIGEWHPEYRTVRLNPIHRTVRNLEKSNKASRLLGTVVFEIINASTEDLRLEKDARAADGGFERDMAGIEPWAWAAAHQYAYEMEFLEYRNILLHQTIMAEAGRTNSHANYFRDQFPTFDAYYRYQVNSGHTQYYEFRYRTLRDEPVVENIPTEVMIYSPANSTRTYPIPSPQPSPRLPQPSPRSSPLLSPSPGPQLLDAPRWDHQAASSRSIRHEPGYSSTSSKSGDQERGKPKSKHHERNDASSRGRGSRSAR